MLIAIAAVATHYFAVFIIAAEAAWLLYALGIRRSTVIATLVLGVACCALVPVVIRQFREHGEPIGGSLRTRVAQIPVHLVVGAGITAVTWGKVALAVMVLLLGFAAWALVARSPSDARRGGSIAVGVALTGILIPVVGAFGGADYFKTLYFVATIPLFAIAVGQGFASARGGVAATVTTVAIGLSITGYVAATPWLQRPDLRGIAASLGSPQVDRAIVLSPTARIGVYMHSLLDVPAGGERVSEVDFVALPTKSAGEVPHPPRSLPREFSLAGFALWKQVFAERYTILRYRAASPERVTTAELLDDSFREWPRNLTTVVEQRAGR